MMQATLSAAAGALPGTTCPICNSPIAHWRKKHTPVGDFAIDRCRDCAFAFVNPRPTPKFLREFYSLSGHSRDGADTGETLEAVVAQEKTNPNSTLDAARIIGTTAKLLTGDKHSGELKGARLLDVGCGYGFYSREAMAHGFQVTAIELAAIERSISRQLTGIEPHNVTFEDFQAPAGSFSAIVMSQILEHARDINGWLEKTHALLQEGGVVAIALPNFGSLFRRVMQENEPFITPPAHLNFFSASNLSRVLVRHGFTVREVAWQSRISSASLRRRIPVVGSYLGSLANVALRGIDSMRMGMMINLYATKSRAAAAGASQ